MKIQKKKISLFNNNHLSSVIAYTTRQPFFQTASNLYALKQTKKK